MDDWHIDGWHDPHRVDSPDVGLVCLWLLTPSPRGGGGTYHYMKPLPHRHLVKSRALTGCRGPSVTVTGSPVPQQCPPETMASYHCLGVPSWEMMRKTGSCHLPSNHRDSCCRARALCNDVITIRYCLLARIASACCKTARKH